MKLKEYKTNYDHYFLDENGLKQGENKEYYSDGQLYIHCFYKDGKLHGEFKRYHGNGNLYIHSYYKDNKRHDGYKEYNRDGTLKYTKYYSNDKDITDMYNKLKTWKSL